MTELKERTTDEEEVVDQREVKRKNKWTAVVQLAKNASEQSTKVIANINSNYVNSQIHNNGNTNAASIPHSAAGMIRINIPSSAQSNGLGVVKKEEVFTKKIRASSSGGGNRAVGRGAR
jgi:hypothetical protein